MPLSTRLGLQTAHIRGESQFHKVVDGSPIGQALHGTRQVSGPEQISRYNGQTTEKSWFNSRSRTRDIPRLQSVQTISGAHSTSYGSQPPPPTLKTSGFTPPLIHKPSTVRKETTLFTFIHVEFSLKMTEKGTKYSAIHLTLSFLATCDLQRILAQTQGPEGPALMGRHYCPRSMAGPYCAAFRRDRESQHHGNQDKRKENGSVCSTHGVKR
jgi:hypothetical protein